MKNYMLVTKPVGCTPTVQFYDDYHMAFNAYDISCKLLGWYSELYEYIEGKGYSKIY